eukprot:16445196-Heterocapsa_arctica.AAC.1
MEDGTRITSINLSGSQEDFEHMLEHCTDCIMLIQEHWRLNEDLENWKSLAHHKGWQGVWEIAKQTEKMMMASQVDQEDCNFSL